MSCGSCGGNCGDKCKKACIKVYKPTSFIGGQTGIPGEPGEPGNNIVNIIDNEDGTFTIVMSDTTEYIITMPSTTVPEDDWSAFSSGDAQITAVDDPTSLGVTVNSFNVHVAYKALGYNVGIVKVRAIMDVNIIDVGVGFNERAIDQVLDFDFQLAEIPIGGSQWFPTEAGSFACAIPGVTGENFGVPVSVRTVGIEGIVFDDVAWGDQSSAGRGSCTGGVGGSIIFCSGVAPKVPAGHYGFAVEWEMVCRIGHPIL